MKHDCTYMQLHNMGVKMRVNDRVDWCCATIIFLAVTQKKNELH
jgi:hypothetical protein